MSILPRFARHVATLDNGLRLVTVELPHLHTVTVVMYAKVGSRFEDANDNGLSHFLEHMLFRGTERHPDAYSLNYAIEELGGTLYAETARDYSLYQLSLHPDSLAGGVALFGEIFRTPAFEGVDVERRIILEEILEDLDEDGRAVNVDDLARGVAFPGHALGRPITGPLANVERFTPADVERHFRRCYGARNMVLTVAGGCEHRAILADVERAMGGLPSGELLTSTPPDDGRKGPQFHFLKSQGSQTNVQVLLRAVPETARDYPSMVALSRILDDGMSTRLHRRVCDELGLAYYVSGAIDSFSDAALLEVDASCAHASLPSLVKEVLKLLADLRETLPSEAELTKAKRRYRWDLEAGFDDPDIMAGWLGGTELYYPPLDYAEKVARIDAVTAEDVRRIASEVVTRETLVVAAVGQCTKADERAVRKMVDEFR